MSKTYIYMKTVVDRRDYIGERYFRNNLQKLFR